MWLRRNIPGKVKDLYRECKLISSQNRPYVYGGGHGPNLDAISPHEGLDCSSSSALALHRVGLYGLGDQAVVSGVFAQKWGRPGKGNYFTVWASGVHVWIQFNRVGQYWRYDTSPQGDGGLGPHMRRMPRFTRTFTPRHWPGL